MSAPTVTIETITPAIAAELLKLNTTNRNIRTKRVAQYARAMRDGDWPLTGEAIQLNGSTLLNGQHRLLACIEADTPFTTVVVRGIESSSMVYMDSGLPRSVADEFRAAGFSNVAQLAATTKMLLMFERGILFNVTSPLLPSRTEIHECAVARRSELDRAIQQSGRLFSAIRVARTAPSSFYAYLMINGVDETTIETFWDSLVDGVGLVEGDPALILRNWLVQSRRRNAAELMFAFVKAWNLFVANERRQYLRTRVGSEPMPAVLLP